MPEPTTTEQTNPLDAGSTTTEFQLSRIMVIGGIVVGILGTLAEALGAIAKVLPNAPPWLGVAVAITGTVAAAAAQLYYTLARSKVKVAAIQAGAAAAQSASLTQAKDVLTGKP